MPTHKMCANVPLRYQVCLDCGSAQTLLRYACAQCGGEHLRWREASGAGTVYAITVVLRAPSADFQQLVPYTLVLVTLAEGPRVMGYGSPGLLIGQAVAASTFEQSGRMLLRFSPTTV